MCFRKKKKQVTFADWHNSVNNFGFNERSGKLEGDFEGYKTEKEREEIKEKELEAMENAVPYPEAQKDSDVPYPEVLNKETKSVDTVEDLKVNESTEEGNTNNYTEIPKDNK